MRVVVLAGGISTEREVSLLSGTMIYNCLKQAGHEVVLLDVFLGVDNISNMETIFEDGTLIDIEKIKEQPSDLKEIKAKRLGWEKNFFGPNVITICQKSDVVFMALHGEQGENGKIQAYFDLMGIKYTGSGALGSGVAMDKGLAKEIMRANNIAIPKGIVLRKKEEDLNAFSYPCVVKVCCGGSSVGVYIVHDELEYERAKKEAFSYEDEVIVEEYIKGREFSIGIIEGKALPIIEIAPKIGFYDYKNKYQAGSAIETCPAQLSEADTIKMQGMAEEVFRVLRLKSYARIDFLMAEDGSMYCLEANTLPGMTPTSLLPQEAKACGMEFVQLCEKIIELALK